MPQFYSHLSIALQACSLADLVTQQAKREPASKQVTKSGLCSLTPAGIVIVYCFIIDQLLSPALSFGQVAQVFFARNAP